MVPQDRHGVHGLPARNLQRRGRRPYAAADLRHPAKGDHPDGDPHTVRHRLRPGGGGCRRRRGVPQRDLAALHHRQFRQAMERPVRGPQRRCCQSGLRHHPDGGRPAQRSGHRPDLCCRRRRDCHRPSGRQHRVCRYADPDRRHCGHRPRLRRKKLSVRSGNGRRCAWAVGFHRRPAGYCRDEPQPDL